MGVPSSPTPCGPMEKACVFANAVSLSTDIMVDMPDEQSIVTYVAQFLERFPELEPVCSFPLPLIHKLPIFTGSPGDTAGSWAESFYVVDGNKVTLSSLPFLILVSKLPVTCIKFFGGTESQSHLTHTSFHSKLVQGDRRHSLVIQTSLFRCPALPVLKTVTDNDHSRARLWSMFVGRVRFLWGGVHF